jgi:hypothetical protein
MREQKMFLPQLTDGEIKEKVGEKVGEKVV